MGPDVLGINVEGGGLGEVEAVLLESQVVLQRQSLLLVLLLVVILCEVGELDPVRIGNAVLLGIGLDDGRKTRVWRSVAVDLLELLGKRIDDEVHHGVLRIDLGLGRYAPFTSVWAGFPGEIIFDRRAKSQMSTLNRRRPLLCLWRGRVFRIFASGMNWRVY